MFGVMCWLVFYSVLRAYILGFYVCVLYSSFRRAMIPSGFFNFGLRFCGYIVMVA